MDYKKIYNNLIESRKVLSRKKNKDVYYERHHILPKSLGGTNDENNLVFLTAREHFIAHLLLTLIFTGDKKRKMLFAFAQMRFKSKYHNKKALTSYEYEKCRLALKEARTGLKHSDATKAKLSKSNTGKIQSQVTKDKKNKLLIGKKRPGVGYKIWETRRQNGTDFYTIEIRKRISESQIGKTHSEETKKKMSQAAKGKSKSEEHKDKLRNRIISEATREKLSNSHKGKKLSEETKEKLKKIWAQKRDERNEAKK